MNKENTATNKSDRVVLVYDGECPICKRVSIVYKLRKTIGELTLINARDSKDHIVLKKISDLGLDLDEGMVFILNNQYYHGKEALNIMAKLSSNHDFFNRLNYILFSSKAVSFICYPVMRAIRNFILKINKISKIKNLENRNKSILEAALNHQWDDLPRVLKKRYAVQPFSNDFVLAKGVMHIRAHGIFKLFLPIFRVFKVLVPYQGESIPTEVRLSSRKVNRHYYFNRVLHFSKGEFMLDSVMIPKKQNETIEYMSSGLGWRFSYILDDKKLSLLHKGYCFRLFGYHIPIPVRLIIGSGYAEEVAISDSEFSLKMEINHPVLGLVYEYGGVFKITTNEK